MEEFEDLIIKEEADINKELFKKHFNFQVPSAIIYSLYNTSNEENKKSVTVIKTELKDLENEIKQMSKEEIKNEKPYKIVIIVEKILEFNKQRKNREGQ